jgi:hypothetical protein
MTSRVQGDEAGPNSWTPVFWSGLTLTRDSASAPPRPVWPGRQSGSSGSLRRFILGDKQELRDTSNSNRDHDLKPMGLARRNVRKATLQFEIATSSTRSASTRDAFNFVTNP